MRYSNNLYIYHVEGYSENLKENLKMQGNDINKNHFDKKDSEVVRPHIQYENDYEIISTEEELQKYFGKKIKKAWFNHKDKQCLRSYILLSKHPEMERHYILIPLINGIAQGEESRETVDVIDFLNPTNLIFAGFIKDSSVIKDRISLNMSGGNIY